MASRADHRSPDGGAGISPAGPVVIVGGPETADGTADDVPLKEAIEAKGVEVAHAVWGDPSVRWGEARAVVVRSPWEIYRQRRREDFLDWARRVASMTALLPSPTILARNTDKRYLPQLAARGIATVPTHVVAVGHAPEPGVVDGFGDDLVVKPAVGASGYGTQRVSRADLGDTLARLHLDDGDAVVQPFRPGILTHGERSIVVIGGTATHAVLKRPGHAEFRVQRHFGGQVEPLPMSAADAAHAQQVVARAAAWFGEPLPWVRVDELVDGDGRVELVELEASDPWLHLERSWQATNALASLVLAAATRSRPLAAGSSVAAGGTH